MSPPLTSSEYRRLVQHSPVMIWRSGLDALCDYFNETWLAFTGPGSGRSATRGRRAWTRTISTVARHLDRFHRREPSGAITRAAAQGVGLGLFIAKAVARAHGGGLEVNSENDETMFRLVLPRQTPTTLAHV